MNNLIELESVGSFIDKESGITYPALINGKPDLEGEVHLLDCDSEWFSFLSEDDDITKKFHLKINKALDEYKKRVEKISSNFF